MVSSWQKHKFVVIAGIAALISSSSAGAVENPQAAAGMGGAAQQAAVKGCFGTGNMIDADLKAFLDNPKGILEMKDSVALMTRVRFIAGSSDTTIVPLVNVAVEATPQQMAALGAGLARAATVCQRPNPQLKLLIEKTVAEMATKDIRLAPLLTAFAKALAEGVTASLGGASRAGVGAPSIGNNGNIGMTWLGSDDGLRYDGAPTAAAPGPISRNGGGDSTITTQSVSATQPVTP